MYAQTPQQRDSLNRQRQADPTILAPVPHTHPATPATLQKADSPSYRQRNDTALYRQRNRIDSLPRDDRDPSRTPRMDRDSIK